MLSRLSLTTLACAPLFLLVSSLFSACDETPRGEQGIDFTDDGSYYNVPPNPEAGPDAHGPCFDEADAGACALATVNAIPYSVLVACSGSAPPAGITCISSGSANDGGVIAYCCSTGIL
jgi:hypothetical protein